MDDWVDIEKPGDLALPIRPVDSAVSSKTSYGFYAVLQEGALRRLDAAKTPIFHVELKGESVYSTFLSHIAPDLQNDHTCSTCRQFADRYGDLALVNDDGTLQPLLWAQEDLGEDTQMAKMYATAVAALHNQFKDKAVSGEFKIIDGTREIGMEEKGGYKHMHVSFPASRVRKEEIAGFTSANTLEMADMLRRVLDDYKLGTIRKVNSILQANKLPYADNHKASTKWLLELVEEDKMGKAKGPVARQNLLCRYAASSFVGSLKQMRSGALSTLLEDVKANCSWNWIQSRWKQVCDPLQYMRPTAAPSQGNIDAAERLFKQLGLTKDDLKRRLLVQDDVPNEVVMWASERMKAKGKPDKTEKVFGAVKAKVNAMNASTSADVDVDVPAVPMTLTRFVTKVLPQAKSVDCWLGRNDTIVTCITGLQGSKPLMQWHDEEGKNLASHYLWPNPPCVEKHNLKPHAWNEVRCLIPFPSLWDGAPLTTTLPLIDPDGVLGYKFKYYHKNKGFRYLFVLEENHESKLSSLALFPENLKSEFHGVRSTIEAYSNKGRMQDVEDGMARGGFVGGVEASRSSSDQRLKFRVRSFNGEMETYKITLFE